MSEKKKYYCEMVVDLASGNTGFGTKVLLNGSKLPEVRDVEVKITPGGLHEVRLTFTPDKLTLKTQEGPPPAE